MRNFAITLAAASALALGACQSPAADKAEDQADAQADIIDSQADAMPEGAAKEATENQADAVRAQGEAKADAIDSGAMTPGEAAAVPPPAVPATDAAKK